MIIEVLMFTTIMSITIGIIAKYKIKQRNKRIREIEEELDKYYIKREQRLKNKGLI